MECWRHHRDERNNLATWQPTPGYSIDMVRTEIGEKVSTGETTVGRVEVEMSEKEDDMRMPIASPGG